MCSADTWLELESTINDKMKLVMNWLSYNKLTLNKVKTVYITFTNHNNMQPENFNVYIHNPECNSNCNCSTINRVSNTKYLGIIIDQHLRWNAHIEHLCKKSRYILFMFYKFKEYFNRKQLFILYFGLFLSFETYGIIGWGRAYTTLLDKLQRIQDKFFKIIFNKKPTQSDKKITILLSIHQYYCFEYLMSNLNYLVNSYKEKKRKRTQEIHK